MKNDELIVTYGRSQKKNGVARYTKLHLDVLSEGSADSFSAIAEAQFIVPKTLGVAQTHKGGLSPFEPHQSNSPPPQSLRGSLAGRQAQTKFGQCKRVRALQVCQLLNAHYVDLQAEPLHSAYR